MTRTRRRARTSAPRGSIEGDKLDTVIRALDEGSFRGQSQRKADEIVRQGGTLTQQLERVRQIDDPKLRDAVQQRVEHMAVVQDRAEREREEQSILLTEAFWNHYHRNRELKRRGVGGA